MEREARGVVDTECDVVKFIVYGKKACNPPPRRLCGIEI